MRKKWGARRVLSTILISAGFVILLIAAVLEARDYPWGLLFGTASQSAESIPDPNPITLDEEDKDITVITNPDAAPIVTEGSTNQLPGDENAESATPASKKYVQLGTFKIPVITVSANLMEGTAKQLKYGVGHVAGTNTVGEAGNCAIAGHRSTYFRYLHKLSPSDTIVIKVGQNTYTYTVFESLTVEPQDTWVLKDVAGENYLLTLITCTPYPTYSQRLIIRARLSDINGLTPAQFYEKTQL